MFELTVRKAENEDLPEIAAIYVYARAQMKANGNPNQWKDNRPSMDTVAADICAGNFYVILNEEKVSGCFAFIIGEDPTYREIEGAWLNGEPYGTIHRIASNGTVPGILTCALKYCEKQIGNIRVDTHEDNRIMQHLLVKNGFKYCGIIITDDGTPRLAYQRRKTKNERPNIPHRK